MTNIFWRNSTPHHAHKGVLNLDREYNRRLIERYPFLLPYNRWTRKPIPNFDYSFTELDEMPDGWRKAFGEQLCEELLEELIGAGKLHEFRIIQIKEQYGSLRFYCSGDTEKIRREIIPKYERLSKRTCILCGEPATKISVGWISPYCDDCANRIGHYENFVSIEEWFSEWEKEEEP